MHGAVGDDVGHPWAGAWILSMIQPSTTTTFLGGETPDFRMRLVESHDFSGRRSWNKQKQPGPAGPVSVEKPAEIMVNTFQRVGQEWINR